MSKGRCRFCTGRDSWRSSPRTRWRPPCCGGRADGWMDLVIESPTAGGHNAPPRGKLQLNAAGEPVYGERDQVNIAELRALGVPFWLAGGYGNAGKAARGARAGRGGRAGGHGFCVQRRVGHAAGSEEDAAGPGVRPAPGRCLPIRWRRRRDFRSRLRSWTARIPMQGVYAGAEAGLRSWLSARALCD